jgi:hypothetical protein
MLAKLGGSQYQVDIHQPLFNFVFQTFQEFSNPLSSLAGYEPTFFGLYFRECPKQCLDAILFAEVCLVEQDESLFVYQVRDQWI